MKIRRGYGFISRSGQPDLFFHVRNLECSRLYEGEEVSFIIAKDKGKDVALEVQRLAEIASGDIVDWRVEPGTWSGQGMIAPHDGGERLEFFAQDIYQSRLGGRETRPRPWYAATYVPITLFDGTTRAVDVRLDWRYPLQRFAYLGDEANFISELKKLTLDENWNYRTSPSKKPFEILYNYLQFTFARLVDEDRGKALPDRKIRERSDLVDHGPLAAFNTGLVDKRYESIFALFEKNGPGREQRWRFMAFCTPGERSGKLLSRFFNPLPAPARYFSATSELLYDPDAPLHPDYHHILNENRDRIPTALLKTVEGMESTRAEATLKMHLDRAIELARKRARWNFKTAIPHYFPSFKRLEFLLPLCMVDDSTVDAALAVQRTETGYIGNTILKLDWAYKSARLVCRPDSDWLAPDRIDVSAEEEPLEAGEF
ncbi:MAG: DUF3825 domain-containing protein [Blastocatellia bacterium]